jgi:type I restriction enzyme S subunit
MSRYETYKPSGIDWIGEVPEHWEVKRLKNTCSLVYGESLAEEIRQDGVIEVFGSNGKVGEHNISNTSEPCIIVGRKGSFGKVNYSYRRVFAIDTTYFIDDRFTTSQLRWLYYILDIIGLDKLSKDTGVPGLNREDAYKEKLPLPPKSEQLAIANYLDDQTQKIDRLIANKKAQAEKLKELRQIEINNAVTKGLNPNAEMKVSGIEWLGEIPKHWEKRKIATNFQIIGSGTTPDAGNEEYYDELGKYYFVNTGDLKDCEIYDCEKKITEEAFAKFSSLKLFPINTLLIAMYGATIGKVGILKTEATTNQACCALANSYRFNIDYMFYFFIGIREDIIRLSYGGGQPNISQDTIKQLRIPCPPKDEQLQIVDHLKKSTKAIDRLVKNIEAQIEKLQELRKIKIYEAVTGKIKVNAYARTTA